MHEAKGVVASLKCYSDQMLKEREGRERKKSGAADHVDNHSRSAAWWARDINTPCFNAARTPVETNGGEREKSRDGWVDRWMENKTQRCIQMIQKWSTNRPWSYLQKLGPFIQYFCRISAVPLLWVTFFMLVFTFITVTAPKSMTLYYKCNKY